MLVCVGSPQNHPTWTVRQAVEAIIRDGTRASAVLVRTRGLLRRGEQLRERLDVNDVIRQVIALLGAELRRNGVSLRTDLPGNLPPVVVDRILLQQVILNLIMNAIEAVRAVKDRARVLRIRTEEQSSGNIVVFVQDSGVGVDPEHSCAAPRFFVGTGEVQRRIISCELARGVRRSLPKGQL
jgi:C4-dicarboxylate-specific signal transduction histidine kinase